MAYYDAFITKWATLNPGTTAAKLAQINAITVAAPLPAVVTPTQVINAIVLADFKGLTQLQQSQFTNILQSGGGTLNGSAGTLVRAWFQDAFSGKATTLANLTALVAPFDNATVPWWQANSYPRAFDLGDCTAAGVS